MMSPLASFAAVRIAAPLPWFTSWKMRTSRLSGVSGVVRWNSSSTARVPSFEQSSTTMISFG